ncbi:hypothetical protein [Streptomyces sp. NPDC002573]|uniref:hypothetical protein n=1 Tax=Streptomyces sp. NPDC002573 TaxID=3364651 RepID=UPI00367AFBB0
MPDFVRERRLFRVVSFAASHRQLLLRSDATAVDGTDTRVEVYFGHMELMLLKPVYQKGIHVRPAPEAEFAVLKERHDLPAEDAGFTWMIEPDGDSFVVSANPSWREAASSKTRPCSTSPSPGPRTSPWSAAASADAEDTPRASLPQGTPSAPYTPLHW